MRCPAVAHIVHSGTSFRVIVGLRLQQFLVLVTNLNLNLQTSLLGRINSPMLATTSQGI